MYCTQLGSTFRNQVNLVGHQLFAISQEFLALGGCRNIALLRYRVAAVTAVVTASDAVYNSSAVTAAMNTRGTTTITILVARGGREKANPA